MSILSEFRIAMQVVGDIITSALEAGERAKTERALLKTGPQWLNEFEAEREVIEPGELSLCCDDQQPIVPGFYCTLPMFHDGDHQAEVGDEVYASWPRPMREWSDSQLLNQAAEALTIYGRHELADELHDRAAQLEALEALDN